MQVGSKNILDDVMRFFGFGNEENEPKKNPAVVGGDRPAAGFGPPNGAIERNLVDRSGILRNGLDARFAARTENRFDYNQIQGVRGNRFVTAEFLNGVESMAQRIGTRPEYILAVMSFETGGTFDPGKRNGIGATGLIQFLPSTAEGLGTSTGALARMSSTEQLRYVEKYFDQPQFRGRLGSLEGLYTAVLSGRARQNGDDVLFTRGTRAYAQNPLDWDNDGRITAGEAVMPVAARMYGGVRAVQQRLVDGGFVPEDQQRNFADGRWGRNSAAALRRFQEANELPGTGLLDDRTARALFGLRPPVANPPAAATTGELSRGSHGPAVTNLQDNLIRLGFLTAAQKATGAGVFGPQTEAALREFQRHARVEPNGRFDAATERAMRDVNLGLGRATTAGNENLTKGIQDRLVELGFLTRAQVDTGYGTFGPRTEDAVRRFQAGRGLERTGRVDDATFAALFGGRRTGGEPTPTDVNYSTATNGRNYTVNPGILMTDALRPRLEELADRYHRQTGGSLQITSGYRPPARQAAAMYDLIEAHGTGYVRNLYADKTAVDQILAAYRNNNASRADAVAAMTRTIGDQVGHGVYISDHLRSRALDVATDANFRALSGIVREMGGSILNEGNHFHIEL
ncbi:MAG: peptidoglycan-binding protein [Acidobacteria bacterium]|nr:peptidoglycan-binding protein [Acidobacteriota bacterium]